MFATALYSLPVVIRIVSRSVRRVEGDDTNSAVAAERLRERGEREKRRQLAIARRKLDERHHDAIEDLADRLVDRLLSRPLAALALAEETGDEELARTVLALYDLDR